MSGSPLVHAVTLLESYRGRDKVMRVVSFGACMGSGLTKNPELSEKLMKVMTEINACRTILRLFDDLSMVAVNLNYGFGKQEKDTVQRIFKLLSNLVNQMFFPIEHIAWAADKGLISLTAAPWWLASLLTWITSLTINILSCVWRVVKLHQKMAAIGRKRSSSSRSSDTTLEMREALHMKRKEYFNLVESLSNLGMAVHWLPGKQLWSGKLSSTAVGALGVISSLVGILKMTALK